MKRLFVVRSTKTNKPLKVDDVPRSLGYDITHGAVDTTGILYFHNKKEAKVLRDLTPFDCYVSRGPDHMGKHGHRIARMRLQPKTEASNGENKSK